MFVIKFRVLVLNLRITYFIRQNLQNNEHLKVVYLVKKLLKSFKIVITFKVYPF